VPDLSDREYFASRAVDSRARAEATRDKAVAAVHLEPAEAYDKLVSMIPDKPRGREQLV
jgi:hypothetical protein